MGQWDAGVSKGSQRFGKIESGDHPFDCKTGNKSNLEFWPPNGNDSELAFLERDNKSSDLSIGLCGASLVCEPRQIISGFMFQPLW